MPIKWNIAGKAVKARGIMDQISAEYDGLAVDGTEHLTDVKAIRSQVGEMKTDLYAAANVMGNSGGAGEAQEQPHAPAAVPQPDPPAPAPQPASAAPENDFRGTFEGRH